eukprot:scaffold4924_cov84-Skeletonema_dohrnii-CCMP3373.AAC.4
MIHHTCRRVMKFRREDFPSTTATTFSWTFHLHHWRRLFFGEYGCEVVEDTVVCRAEGGRIVGAAFVHCEFLASSRRR